MYGKWFRTEAASSLAGMLSYLVTRTQLVFKDLKLSLITCRQWYTMWWSCLSAVLCSIPWSAKFLLPAPMHSQDWHEHTSSSTSSTCHVMGTRTAQPLWTLLIFKPMIDIYSMYYHGTHLPKFTDSFSCLAAYPNCVDLPLSTFIGSGIFSLQISHSFSNYLSDYSKWSFVSVH